MNLKQGVLSCLSILIFCSGLQAASEGVRSQLPPAHVVNFSQLAAYEVAHPPKYKRKFIRQGEDRDKKFRYQHKTDPANAVKVNWPLPASGHTRTPSPLPFQSFNGIMDNGNTIPPDIRGAAGIDYLVQTTNQQISIYEKSGTLNSTISLSAFFAGAGGQNGSYFDPHVVYDPLRQRFIACAGGNLINFFSGVFLAVSQTSDPTGNWYVYGFDGTGNANDLLDFPVLGFNTNWVVITGNDFTSSSIIGKIFVVNRDSVYNGNGASLTTFVDNTVFTLAPAITLDAGQNVEYMVQNAGSSGGLGFVQFNTITGTPNAPIYTNGPVLGINHPWEDFSQGAPQSGSSNTLEDGDNRIEQAVYINGSMWFSHTVFLPAGGFPTHAGVDWWQTDPSVPSIIQFGRIEDQSGANFYFYPSIHVNANGDALLGYCQSSPQMFASAAYSFRAVGDPPNTMQDSYLYKAGLGPYFKTFGSGRNRWGDYTCTAVDPVNQSFWNFNEWANTGNNWGTVIANVLASTDSTCYPPINTTNTEITDSSVRLGWIPVSQASRYLVQYQVAGSSSWISDTTSGSSYFLTGLTGSTLYEWQVSSICISGDTSVFTASSLFQTRMKCTVPDPVVTQDDVCAGEAATLTASGAGILTWFADSTGDVALDTGVTFLTPPLSAPTEYYVQSVVNAPSQFVGPADSTLGGSGTGGYIATHSYHNLLFHCFNPTRLVSVLVYAQNTANRTITLKKNGGTIYSKSVSVPAGASRVQLGFDIPAGNFYELGCQGHIALYRNTAGAIYPYTLNGLISIIGNDVDTGSYFFFYDWELSDPPCLSARIPVQANVDTSVVAAFDIDLAVDTVLCSDSSLNATSWLWTFGDISSGAADTSTLQNPTHVYAGMDSVYTICLTVMDSISGCSSTSCQQVLVGGVGLPELAKDYFSLYPNPATDRITLQFGPAAEGKPWVFSLTDVTGAEVVRQTFRMVHQERKYELNVSGFAAGTYLVTLINEGAVMHSRVIIR